MAIQKEPFGTAPDGQHVDLYTLENQQGLRVKITNYGAIVTSFVAPDRTGALGDVVAGFDELGGYIPNDPHFGGIVGRFANRIAYGKFALDGHAYTLSVNDPPHHLHGGYQGFDRVVWQAEELPQQNALRLTYLSPDGEEGYPGNLTATVTYTLTEDNALQIEYTATTDKATPVNLTNHSYFNLAAGKATDISEHVIQILADMYTPVDETLIPTGELASLADTPMDFREPQPIGKYLHEITGGGYDHNYVLRSADGSLTKAAQVYEPTSGRVLEVFTTHPGVQFYTGNFLDGSLTGRGGHQYTKHYAFCLETQHFPDSPNQPGFPSAILRPGETYRRQTIYRLSVQES